MSNPLVFIPSFYLSLGEVLRWTPVVLAVCLPWLRIPRIPWPWLLFLGLALASHLWTINDFHTHVSNIVYLEVTAVAVLAAANCTPEVIGWGIGLGGVAVVTLSAYAYELELPGTSNAMVGGADFTGIGTNENILAYTLAVSFAAIVALGWPTSAGLRVGWLFSLVAVLYGLYLAGSATGYIVVLAVLLARAAALPVGAMGWSRRRTIAAAAGAGLFSLLLAALCIVVLGKDLVTFSGRSTFWKATIAATFEQAPVLGSGWGAVWAHPWNPAPYSDVVEGIYSRASYAVPHGHNFFVDVLPELGLVGVGVALLMVAYAAREVRRCGVRAGGTDPLTGRLVLLVLVALLVSGITEPMLTVPIGWWSLALVTALPRQRLLHFWRVDAAPRRTRTPRSRGKRAAR